VNLLANKVQSGFSLAETALKHDRLQRMRPKAAIVLSTKAARGENGSRR
jgi:hypothetical protein